MQVSTGLVFRLDLNVSVATSMGHMDKHQTLTVTICAMEKAATGVVRPGGTTSLKCTPVSLFIDPSIKCNIESQFQVFFFLSMSYYREDPFLIIQIIQKLFINFLNVIGLIQEIYHTEYMFHLSCSPAHRT